MKSKKKKKIGKLTFKETQKLLHELKMNGHQTSKYYQALESHLDSFKK